MSNPIYLEVLGSNPDPATLTFHPNKEKKMNKIIAGLVGFVVLFPVTTLAWDGYDYDSGNYVEIEKGNLVRTGKEIEYYDYDSGEYRTGDVEDITSTGNSVEVEVYDHDSGEYRTFEMED